MKNFISMLWHSFYTSIVVRVVAVLILGGVVAQGCTPPTKCMAANEWGEVVKAEGGNSHWCGRGGCYDTPYSTITVRMPNRVSRVCRMNEVSPNMVPVGERVSLTEAYRVM